jgi:hypothetical protein
LANTNNLSDIVLAVNYNFMNKEESAASVIIGAKIPLNNSNVTINNNSLPMHYQSSLGTYDLIFGVNYLQNKLGVSLALQQPVIQSNENEFITPTDPNLKEFKYQSTNQYERKGDIVNRISYNFSLLENKLYVRPGILNIYHLGNDIYYDESNIKTEIKGSNGLTVNGNIFIAYRFTPSKQLELSIGSPFITRDSRPDGLTRKLVVGLEYLYSF